jgi:uncharacterized cupin superfamily protein
MMPDIHIVGFSMTTNFTMKEARDNRANRGVRERERDRENGEWNTGKWRMKNGEWRMENGEWRMESAEQCYL